MKKHSVKKTVSLLLAFVTLCLYFAPSITAYAASRQMVEFGSYPQSRVTQKSTLKTLEAADKNWKSYNYYAYGEATDCMEYADMDTDGDGRADYRAVRVNSCRPSSSYFTSIMNQEYSGYPAGNTYYFKYEPLVWLVLDSSEGLLLSKDVIDSQAFNNEYHDYYRTHGYEYKFIDGVASCTFIDSEYTKPVNVWEYSSIREWLNSDFYDSSFSDSEKNSIKTTAVENTLYTHDPNDFDHPVAATQRYVNYHTYNTTNDKVFLPSVFDISNTSYGFDNYISAYDTVAQHGYSNSGKTATRKCISTDYSRCQGIPYMLQIREMDRENSGFLLRTSGWMDHIWDVKADGLMDESMYDADFTGFGIRPEICVNNTASLKKHHESFFSRLIHRIKLFFEVFFSN